MKAWPVPYRFNGHKTDLKAQRGTEASLRQRLRLNSNKYQDFIIIKFSQVVRKVTVKYAGQQTQDRGNVNASSFISQVELNFKLQVFWVLTLSLVWFAYFVCHIRGIELYIYSLLLSECVGIYVDYELEGRAAFCRQRRSEVPKGHISRKKFCGRVRFSRCRLLANVLASRVRVFAIGPNLVEVRSPKPFFEPQSQFGRVEIGPPRRGDLNRTREVTIPAPEGNPSGTLHKVPLEMPMSGLALPKLALESRPSSG
ncbi:hypothetical protein DFH08DRAFT_940524 [Mycena albidolilacea]|uniref:Uncharacterized protein n=1 Tax=Mycena albidolilacea TaxID=1033008 RepID=A0AAD7EIV0_9AGAR|nr:hypothetical protein DFH08DRAFT_940524 [Mycena albidolilacea]